ncbi:hypothetical protein [Clostridium sp. USBA 49]|uniref:hypothetical protein n=1 Tax=Clostridium sp. USBA 49 TaxID=1881060 RepID=UPI001FA8EEA6|nr:hypothetical protein [Clostridium sp. USBA 49]
MVVFKEIISIKDGLRKDFYTTMCSTERWSVRTIRERISSAISKKPELTIINDLKLLREENKSYIKIQAWAEDNFEMADS